MDRRQSLKVLTLGSLTAGTVLSACQLKDGKETAAHSEGHDHAPAEGGDAQRPPVEAERDARLMKEKFFTEHEMLTITVLGNLVIPADDRSGNAEEAGAPEFIEFIVKDRPEFQTPMRGGLRWLDVECLHRFEKGFTDCSETQQTEVLDDIAWPETARPEMRMGVNFFSLFRNLVATGFWTSKIGIEDIGYQGNVTHIWDGVPQEVLNEYGLAYDEEIPYVTPADRESPMQFGNA